jgi:hypothetical protein
MTVCSICGEELPPDRKVCDVCGTNVPSNTPSAANPSLSGPTQSPPPLPTGGSRPASTPSGRHVCSLCHTIYGPEYDDEFCRCGGELLATSDLPVEPEVSHSLPAGSNEIAPQRRETTGHVSLPESVPGTATDSTEPIRPPAGTDCLVVYSEQKKPIHYCAIDKDVTVIGRRDEVRGDFPDLDLGKFFEQATARKISRKHALVLRLRDSRTYLFRPLGGNTGTQIEREMAEPLHDYPLTVGMRMVLGGAVRLKFEKMT